MSAANPTVNAQRTESETTDTSTTTGTRGSVGDGVTVGLALMGILSILLMVLIGEVVPPLVAFGLLFTGLSVASRRTAARWVRVVGAILAAALLVIFSPFAAGDLAHPESAASFGPTWVLVVAGVATMIACVVAATSRTLRTRTVWGVASVVILAGVAFTVLQASDLRADAPQVGDVTLAVEGAVFPERLVVPAGLSGLFIDNVDPIRHTFNVEGSSVAQELPGSTTRRVDLDLPVGEYRYFCDIAGHESMEGVLVVTG